METVNHHIFRAMDRFRDRPMQVGREGSWTYGEAAEAVHGVALGLGVMGVRPGDRVALIAENSPRWFHAYAGILAAGGVVVPRGEDTTDEDLGHILRHSDCKVVLAGSKRIAARLPSDRPVSILDGDGFPPPAKLGRATLRAYAAARRPEDLAVLLYTSGTTGTPKGVMLEQRNLAHNIRVLPDLVGMGPGDLWVSVLPSWHTFEQTVELCGFSVGCVTAYSDKRHLREDLRRWRPQFFASVPRIWETVHKGAMNALAKKGRFARALYRTVSHATRAWQRGNPLGLPLHLLGDALFYKKIRELVGGRLKVAVSGGGYLPPRIDTFFNQVGITLLVGYGLTETAPVVALRPPDANRAGTIGRALPETEIRIGPAGTIQVRGPQVMRGYYRDPDLTRRVLDESGWFDTGDLGRLTPEGDLIFQGRIKETIVLSGGENVEPEPIENRILQSDRIAQVIVVGQDRKTLGALVVPAREFETSEEEIRKEVRRRTGPRSGLRPCEAVCGVALLEEPFTVENGLLTATLKMRRGKIHERYAQTIDALYR